MAAKKAKATGAASASDRARASKAAKIAAGYVSKSLLLSPAAAAALETLKQREKRGEAEIVESALLDRTGNDDEWTDAEILGVLKRRLERSK
jgi:rRNA pseudouridine-1189 N-methylase Emg1 (Nep1/Mra1 family)